MTNEQFLGHVLHLDPRGIKTPEGKRTGGGIIFKNEKGRYFEITVPDGYLQLGESHDRAEFATVRKEDPEKSLCLVKIVYSPYNMREGRTTIADDELEEYYRGTLSMQGYRNMKDSHIRLPQKVGHYFDYAFVPGFMKKTFYCRDTVLLAKETVGYYVLTVAAPADSFPQLESQLNSFSDSFFAPDLHKMTDFL